MEDVGVEKEEEAYPQPLPEWREEMLEEERDGEDESDDGADADGGEGIVVIQQQTGHGVAAEPHRTVTEREECVHKKKVD